MDEETTGQPPVETEAPEAEAEAEAPEEVTEPEGEETEEEAPEEVEYDLGGGQRLKVAANASAKEVFEAAQKAFKDVEANFTRKNQDVAEKAKALEAREKAVERLSNLNDKVLDEFSRGRAVQRELEQLGKVDLNALWQSPNPQDRDQARRVSDRISQKQAELNAIVQNVSRIESELSTEQAQERARRLEEGKREVARRIPNADQVIDKVIEYAVSKGLPKEAASDWPANPLFTEMAWKAWMFDEAQAKAQKAAKPKPPQAQPVQTTRSTGGRAKLDLNRDADKLSAEEWARRRNAELRARANAR